MGKYIDTQGERNDMRWYIRGMCLETNIWKIFMEIFLVCRNSSMWKKMLVGNI